MKLMKKISLLLLICLTCSVMLTGCANMAGTYKFQSMVAEVGGIKAELVVGEKYLGYLTLTEDFMVLTLEKNGTATLSAISDLGSRTGTWEKTGKKELTLTFGNDTQKVIIDGKNLILEDDIGTVTLKKTK